MILNQEVEDLIKKIVHEEILRLDNSIKNINKLVDEEIKYHLSIINNDYSKLNEERGLFNGHEIVTAKIIDYCKRYISTQQPNVVSRYGLRVWNFMLPSNIFSSEDYKKLFFYGLNAKVVIVSNPNEEKYDKRGCISYFNSFRSEIKNGKLYNPSFGLFCEFSNPSSMDFILKATILHEFTHAYRNYHLRADSRKEAIYTQTELPKIKRLNVFGQDVMKSPTEEKRLLYNIFQFIYNDEPNAYISGAYSEMEKYIETHRYYNDKEVINDTRPITIYKDVLMQLDKLKGSENTEEIMRIINQVYNRKFDRCDVALDWLENQVKQLGLYITKKVTKLYGRVVQDTRRRMG